MPPTNNRKYLILAAVAAIILVIIGTAFVVINSVQKPGGPSATPSEGKIAAGEPEFEGIDDMLDQGITTAQVESLKFAFYKYFKDSHKSVNTVKLTNAIHVHDMNATPPDLYTFNVELDDGSKFKGKIDTSDISSIHFHLMDAKSGAVIYDSGIVAVETD